MFPGGFLSKTFFWFPLASFEKFKVGQPPGRYVLYPHACMKKVLVVRHFSKIALASLEKLQSWPGTSKLCPHVFLMFPSWGFMIS